MLQARKNKRLPKFLTLDLSQDEPALALYEEHPYFPDIVEWMAGSREKSQIRHCQTPEEFFGFTLPNALRCMQKLGLVKKLGERWEVLCERVTLKNIPTDFVHTCALEASQCDALLQASFGIDKGVHSEVLRVRISPETKRIWEEKLSEFLRQLSELHCETGTETVFRVLVGKVA